MKKLLLFLVTSLIACTSNPPNSNRVNYTKHNLTTELNFIANEAETLNIYKRMFQTEAELRGISLDYDDIRIYLIDDFSEELRSRQVVGLCVTREDKRVIFIGRARFKNMDSLEREMLLFHEMGHCVLGLDHDESTSEEGTPFSIMYPVLLDSSVYGKSRTLYLNELFNKVKVRLQAQTPDSKVKDYKCSDSSNKKKILSEKLRK